MNEYHNDRLWFRRITSRICRIKIQIYLDMIIFYSSFCGQSLFACQFIRHFFYICGLYTTKVRKSTQCNILLSTMLLIEECPQLNIIFYDILVVFDMICKIILIRYYLQFMYVYVSDLHSILGFQTLVSVVFIKFQLFKVQRYNKSVLKRAGKEVVVCK